MNFTRMLRNIIPFAAAALLAGQNAIAAETTVASLDNPDGTTTVIRP